MTQLFEHYPYLASVISLIFQSNNVDARGWWPFIIILGAIYALLFGLVFAAFALLLNKEHSSYTKNLRSCYFLAASLLACLLITSSSAPLQS